jgi:hypothetical protein
VPQTWSADAHVAGGVQTPWSQRSVALQHGTALEQLSVVRAQATDAPWHVPPVAPGAMAQARPAQQSPSTVHDPPEVEQAGAVTVASPQRPPTHDWLQQSLAAVAAVQLPPASLHVGDDPGGRQA